MQESAVAAAARWALRCASIGHMALLSQSMSVRSSAWFLNSEECECGPVSVGTTSVAISSTYPEDVTMNLIHSLKIVKGEAAAAVAGEQVLPPE